MSQLRICTLNLLLLLHVKLVVSTAHLNYISYCTLTGGESFSRRRWSSQGLSSSSLGALGFRLSGSGCGDSFPGNQLSAVWCNKTYALRCVILCCPPQGLCDRNGKKQGVSVRSTQVFFFRLVLRLRSSGQDSWRITQRVRVRLAGAETLRLLRRSLT